MGMACSPDWWKELVQKKKEHDDVMVYTMIHKLSRSAFGRRKLASADAGLEASLEQELKEVWENLVGLD